MKPILLLVNFCRTIRDGVFFCCLCLIFLFIISISMSGHFGADPGGSV
jgi:hypothetical protein